MSVVMSISLPAPAPLVGVKSQKKPIFKLASAEAHGACGQPCRVPHLSLALESRVAAVGDAVDVVVPLLLGEKEPTGGAVAAHDSLAVVHLGPHLVGDVSATAQQHLDAVAAALKGKPQVIVLDEGVPTGGAGWQAAFRAMLRHEQLDSFKGAVVVCAHELTFGMKRVCREQYALQGGTLVQTDLTRGCILDVVEDAIALASRVGEREDAAPRKKGGRAASRKGASKDDEVRALLDEARALSDHEFEQDIVELCKRKGWSLALLVESPPDSDARVVRGYISYKVRSPPRAEVEIKRLAVPKQCRGRGFGRVLVNWLAGEAARMPQSQCQALTAGAFLDAVAFYEACGFAAAAGADGAGGAPAEDADSSEDGSDEDDPQLWMQRPVVSLITEA